jgi:Arc/MetJ family transcription regulator
MKTTLDIPADLMDEAMRACGARTKRSAVLTALGDLARRGRMRDLANRLGNSTSFMTSERLEALRVKEMPE